MTPSARIWEIARCAALVALSMQVNAVNANEIVHFQSATFAPSRFQIDHAARIGRTVPSETAQELAGQLYKPPGNGPFAAVILLHGCGGIWRWDETWSTRLVQWGYVALNVDSFGPRKITSVCGNGRAVSDTLRALDAYGAKSFLNTLPFVDRGRIAVMGMSHGGWAALAAIRYETTLALRTNPFRAAVTLYPWCDEPVALNAPVLILIGDQDDWSPAERCRKYAATADSAYEVVLKEYPEAHHLFDLPDVNEEEDGHVLKYDPQASSDAIERVRAFLVKHL